ncbi:MAG: glycosyltransferase family 2 protein [Candidatus Heimdallarchaeota archaeon]
MARRLLEYAIFLLILSTISVLIVVAVHIGRRFITYIEVHGKTFLLDFLLWPLKQTDVWYRYIVFLSWLAFFFGICFMLGTGLRILVSKLFFRKSLLIEVPPDPKHRKSGQKIIAVIPAYNEENTIAQVITKTQQYVDDIVVVNDGSEDKTENIALDLGVNVITHLVHSGLGPTMRDGLAKALELDADIIVTIDADGQYVEEEIPRVIYPIAQGKADLVLGSRTAGQIENMALVKRFGNRILTWAVGVLTGCKFTDTQTGFRAMTSMVAESLKLKGQYTYTQEMVLQIAQTPFTICEVPITFNKRKYGESRLIATAGDYGFRTLGIILKTVRDYSPLTFFGIIGFLLMAVGGYIAGDSAIKWSQKLPISTSTVILAFLFISVGSQILLFGFMADMLKHEREKLVEMTPSKNASKKKETKD